MSQPQISPDPNHSHDPVELGILTKNREKTPLAQLYLRWCIAATTGTTTALFVPVSDLVPEATLKALGPLADLVIEGATSVTAGVFAFHYCKYFIDPKARQRLTDAANAMLGRENKTLDDKLRITRNNAQDEPLARPLISEILRFRRTTAQPG